MTPETSSFIPSGLREITRVPIDKLAERLVKAYPAINPNAITLLGGLCSEIASKAAKDGNTLASIAFGSASLGLDGLDGAVARALKKIFGRNNPLGDPLDTAVDKYSESKLAQTTMINALDDGNRLDAILALLLAGSITLPALFRALEKERGHKPNEAGEGGILGTIGTRQIRGPALLLLANLKNQPERVNPRTVASAALLAGNLYNGILRLLKSREPSPNLQTAESIRQAALNKKVVAALGTIMLTASICTYLNHPKKTR